MNPSTSNISNVLKSFKKSSESDTEKFLHSLSFQKTLNSTDAAKANMAEGAFDSKNSLPSYVTTRKPRSFQFKKLSTILSDQHLTNTGLAKKNSENGRTHNFLDKKRQGHIFHSSQATLPSFRTNSALNFKKNES
jgi:hypothetical protein